MARICMVAYTIYPDTRIQREAEALVERGDTVDLVCLRGRYREAPKLYRGVQVLQLPIGRYRGSSSALYMASYLMFFALALAKVAELHLRDPYQVIQVHTMPDSTVLDKPSAYMRDISRCPTRKIRLQEWTSMPTSSILLMHI